MMSKRTLTIIIVFACLAIIAGAKFIAKTNSSAEAKSVHAKGNPQAKVKITEYIDFQCPACATGAKILSMAVNQHPNDIYLELKNYPLENIHAHAMLSAQYAWCAGEQGSFWPFHDELINRQAFWKGLANADPAFQEIAKELKLNENQLNACLERQDIPELIMQQKAEGEKLGIRSTPSYVINGTLVVGTKSLQEELNKNFPGE